MTKFALYVPLEAKPGKEKEVADFLRSAVPLVNAEPHGARNPIRARPLRRGGRSALGSSSVTRFEREPFANEEVLAARWQHRVAQPGAPDCRVSSEDGGGDASRWLNVPGRGPLVGTATAITCWR
jgi:hypothetical protein